MISNYEQGAQQTFNRVEDWNDFDEAIDCLERFCIILNYQFQGNSFELDISSRW